jgi:hypothetical protein
MTPIVKLDISDWKIPTDLQLADEAFNQPAAVDILIGADVFYETVCPGRKTRPEKYPVLQETMIGWTVSGKTPDAVPNHTPHQMLLIRGNTTLDEKLQCFWDLDSFDKLALTVNSISQIILHSQRRAFSSYM